MVIVWLKKYPNTFSPYNMQQVFRQGDPNQYCLPMHRLPELTYVHQIPRFYKSCETPSKTKVIVTII